MDRHRISLTVKKVEQLDGDHLSPDVSHLAASSLCTVDSRPGEKARVILFSTIYWTQLGLKVTCPAH